MTKKPQKSTTCQIFKLGYFRIFTILLFYYIILDIDIDILISILDLGWVGAVVHFFVFRKD